MRMCELLLHATSWRNHKGTTLSEKSVSEVMYYVSRPMYKAFLKQQITEREFSGCQGSGRQRAREMTTAMKV